MVPEDMLHEHTRLLPQVCNSWCVIAKFYWICASSKAGAARRCAWPLMMASRVWLPILGMTGNAPMHALPLPIPHNGMCGKQTTATRQRTNACASTAHTLQWDVWQAEDGYQATHQCMRFHCPYLTMGSVASRRQLSSNPPIRTLPTAHTSMSGKHPANMRGQREGGVYPALHACIRLDSTDHILNMWVFIQKIAAYAVPQRTLNCC
jgi:hypothetical protein